MDLTAQITKRMAGAGLILALVAAVFLAAAPRVLLAQSDAAAHQPHAGSVCVSAYADPSPPEDEKGMPGSHGDCLHHFHPMVRASAKEEASGAYVMVPVPQYEAARSRTLAFDPPPPRYPI